jgi:hypothetical protein
MDPFSLMAYDEIFFHFGKTSNSGFDADVSS